METNINKSIKQSEVFFVDTREHHHYNSFDKIKKLLNSVKYDDIIKKNDLVAIKIHFGEYGNSAFIRPQFIRIIVDELKKIGAKPFLTDGSTLYKGSRSDAVNHLETAIKNGFDFAVVNAPLIIADGLKGDSCVRVKINGKHFEYAEIAAESYRADALVIVSHFKLHELTGFGGSIKNISMGLASKAGKLAMHSSVAPKINGSYCKKCMRCYNICPVSAFEKKEKSLKIIEDVCIGCGQCIMICPFNAINIVWNAASNDTQEKMAEYAAAILSNKRQKYFCFNFLQRIAPECDCYSHSDTSIVQDIGILASRDIVAIDRASVDLLNSAEGLKNTALKNNFNAGADKIKGVYPHIDWSTQLNYSEKLGLGAQNYNLIKI